MVVGCKPGNLATLVYTLLAWATAPGPLAVRAGSLHGGTRERAAKLPKDDWRSRNPNFNEPLLSQYLAFVERLRAIGQRYGRSPGEVAIAWTLKNPAVTGAIVDARDAKQAEGVMRAGDLALTDQDIQEIETSLVDAVA